jgi:hypothetical protein
MNHRNCYAVGTFPPPPAALRAPAPSPNSGGGGKSSRAGTPGHPGYPVVSLPRIAILALAAIIPFAVVIGSVRGTASPRIHAQSNTLTVAGQLGGPIQAVTQADGLSFISIGPRVVIQSACDPAFPDELGRTAPLPDIVRDIAVRDGYAYVADSGGGLVILDVRNPAAPRMVGRTPLEGVAAMVRLKDNLAYVAAGAKGLWIVDISDPMAPREIGVYRAIVTDFALYDSYAYVVTRNLEQVNVSNPAAPRLERKLEDWSDAIDAVGQYLFVAISEARPGTERFGSLRVYDVSNPRQPTALHTVPIGDQARAVLVQGDRVYYQGPARLTAVAQSIPGSLGPVLGAVVTTDSVQNLYATGHQVLLAAGRAGLRVVDAGNPAAMRERQVMDTLGSAESVAIWGSYAFVEDEGAGNRILVVEIADPATPRVIAAIPVGADHGALTAAGNGYLYVGTPDRQLRVFDVRAPSQPRQIAAIAMPRDPLSGREMSIWRIVVEKDSHVYLANDEWLRVYDVTDPASPREVSRWRTSGGATDLAVHDRRAYILGPSTGSFPGRPSLQIVDVFDFAKPIEFGVISAIGSQGGAQTDGEAVFVEGLQVVDVRNPERPADGTRLTLEGRNRDSTLFEKRLYLARSDPEGGGSLLVLDAAHDAANPGHVPARVIATLDLPDQARDVAVAGGYAYVAAQGLGLLTVRDRDLPTPPVPTPQPTPTGEAGRPELPVKVFMPVAARGVVGTGCR